MCYSFIRFIYSAKWWHHFVDILPDTICIDSHIILLLLLWFQFPSSKEQTLSTIFFLLCLKFLLLIFVVLKSFWIDIIYFPFQNLFLSHSLHNIKTKPYFIWPLGYINLNTLQLYSSIWPVLPGHWPWLVSLTTYSLKIIAAFILLPSLLSPFHHLFTQIHRVVRTCHLSLFLRSDLFYKPSLLIISIKIQLYRSDSEYTFFDFP